MDTISINLRRAQEAIARARCLSAQLGTSLNLARDAEQQLVPAGPPEHEAVQGEALAAQRGLLDGPLGSDEAPETGLDRHSRVLQAARQGLPSIPDQQAGPAASYTQPCRWRQADGEREGLEQWDSQQPEEGVQELEGETEGRGTWDGNKRAGSGEGASTSCSPIINSSSSDGGGGEGEDGGEDGVHVTNLMRVVQQVAQLQRKQTETLNQLLVLRMQQLKLRQQQLTALQELLTAEVAAVEGTPLQVSAVAQAVELLAHSLRDMRTASRALLFSKSNELQAVSAAVSATDLRADEVSRMARQLLGVLRSFPRRNEAGSQPDSVPGASALTISGIPTTTCSATSPLLGQTCCICLGNFEQGDKLKAIQCTHYHHSACLDEWLRIRACCPLCKAVLQ